MHKKGVSPVIAYVLLISLAVGLGALVFNFYIGTTEKQTETFLDPIEGGMECDSVNINVGFDNENIKIYNSGMLSINKLKIDFVGLEEYLEIEEEQEDMPLLPKKDITISEDLPEDYGGVIITPFIKTKTQIISCYNGRIYHAPKD